MNALDWRVVALSTASFLALSYSVCLLGDVLFGYELWRGWAVFLPGLDGLSWRNYFIGLLATAVYGVYGALIFVPLYNFYLQRLGKYGNNRRL